MKKRIGIECNCILSVVVTIGYKRIPSVESAYLMILYSDKDRYILNLLQFIFYRV